MCNHHHPTAVSHQRSGVHGTPRFLSKCTAVHNLCNVLLFRSCILLSSSNVYVCSHPSHVWTDSHTLASRTRSSSCLSLREPPELEHSSVLTMAPTATILLSVLLLLPHTSATVDHDLAAVQAAVLRELVPSAMPQPVREHTHSTHQCGKYT